MRSPHPPIFPPTPRPPPSDTHPSHTFENKKTNKPPRSCVVSPAPSSSTPHPKPLGSPSSSLPRRFYERALGSPPEGKRMEGRQRQQAQSEADASERAELARPPGWSSGTTHQFGSVSSSLPPSPRAFGRRLVNVAPAVMASRPEPIQPLNTQLLSA